MKLTPDLSITIVNYNTSADLHQCLQSVFKYTQKYSIEVFVVDNNSTDSSVSMIKKNFPRVKLIANKHNAFFSEGNNQGLKRSAGKYLLVLAPDAILQPRTIGKIINFMNSHPDCGLATVRQINQQRQTLMTCQKNHTPLTEIFNMPLWQKFFFNTALMKKFRYEGWNRLDIREVDTVPGAFMFMRRETVKAAGLMDPKFKIFYSDADLAVRIKSQSWKIYHYGLSSFVHLKARSIGKLNQPELMKIAEHDRSHYARKHFGWFWFIVIYLLGQINLGMVRIIYYLKK